MFTFKKFEKNTLKNTQPNSKVTGAPPEGQSRVTLRHMNAVDGYSGSPAVAVPRARNTLRVYILQLVGCRTLRSWSWSGLQRTCSHSSPFCIKPMAEPKTRAHLMGSSSGFCISVMVRRLKAVLCAVIAVLGLPRIAAAWSRLKSANTLSAHAHRRLP